MTNYFKNKTQKTKTIFKIYTTLTAKLKSVATVVIIGANTISATLFALHVLVWLYYYFLQECHVLHSNTHDNDDENIFFYEKKYEKDHQTVESFDKLYRKILHDNLIGTNK